MIRPFHVPAETHVFFGAPAQPMPATVLASIASAATAIHEISEAHLPQCFVPGVMDAPAQVLVLVVADDADPDRLFEAFDAGLGGLLPPRASLDVWPMHKSSPLLSAVRGASCCIRAAAGTLATHPGKRWWKFWD